MPQHLTFTQQKYDIIFNKLSPKYKFRPCACYVNRIPYHLESWHNFGQAIDAMTSLIRVFDNGEINFIPEIIINFHLLDQFDQREQYMPGPLIDLFDLIIDGHKFSYTISGTRIKLFGVTNSEKILIEV